MASLSAPTFTFAPGKTWFMSVTYLQRNADGSAGAPVNLTGGVVSGILFTRGNLGGIPLTVANGGVTVDPLNGAMNFLVDETTTAGFVADTIPPFVDCYNYPTRLEVDFRDALGHLGIAAVFPIYVFDPRFVDPSTFPVAQSGTIVAPGAQLAAAAPVLVNGMAPDATGNITLGAHDVGAVSADDVAALIAAALAKFSPAAPAKASTLSVTPAYVAFGVQSAGLTRSTKLQASPALIAMAGGLATLLKTAATVSTPVSTPGGGPNNVADHSDPNNAYLAAMAA